jgi:hypothetical protein
VICRSLRWGGITLRPVKTPGARKKWTLRTCHIYNRLKCIYGKRNHDDSLEHQVGRRGG